MKLTKIFATTSIALAGFLAFNETVDVDAAEWEARTVEQVQADMKVEEGDVVSYTVQSGDTLGVIAAAADVDLNALAAANGIEDANIIFPGNKLSFTEDAQGEVTEVTVSDASGHEEASYQVSAQAAPAQQQTQTNQAPAQQQSQGSSQGTAQTGGEAAAKEWIAQRESGGSYSAYNPAGGYYGRYQLNPSLVSYGASPAQQEAAADAYVAGRYGSWTNAQSFWQANGWY
ncbi:LysM peptidoglycan-binding domain-containing protein [Aerococcus kribbianus]|uniref:LysM peptidoglycan-binding domain-containing protein n=1 Tax=Aerococcus kribbianus TaxID=2999064 RepID=A0A9X3FNI3_9LACT|nr:MULTISPECIES: LysM peptidoglycan-binding domain-containing protein [unclassified Aerococcus]MCZ0717549.1 LysM peptidoglycan-binding domain-containing protein [Aerococcus sp. YH-aer221]MCZ0725837.1 LysM peptidoglycan-binding domain-containing protein [Aerococcus sp. YH-aer222]